MTDKIVKIEIDKEEVELMIKFIKKHRRDVATIIRAYKTKKYGANTNEFGQKYSQNYLYGILQAFEMTLTCFGYTKKQLNSKDELDAIIRDLETQGAE